MSALTVHQAADVLGVSERALRDMVRRGVVLPLPGTGGQGKQLLFDAESIRAYADNADLADVLARAVLAFPSAPPGAARAWAWSYDSEGRHKRQPLCDRLRSRWAYARPVRPGAVSHVRYGWGARTVDHDESLARCLCLCLCLSRRECEFLIGALIASAHPLERGFKTRGPDRVSVAVRERKAAAAKWKSPDNPDFFWHEFARFSDAFSNESRRLFPFIAAAAAWKDLPPDVKAAWKAFQGFRSGWKWATVRNWSLARLDKFRMPPAASVGRIIGMKRAQAAKIWRTLQPRLPRWYLELFRV